MNAQNYIIKSTGSMSPDEFKAMSEEINKINKLPPEERKKVLNAISNAYNAVLSYNFDFATLLLLLGTMFKNGDTIIEPTDDATVTTVSE